MSEAEIVEQLAVIYDRYWSVFQWWGSMSIGLLLVGHFSSDRLSLGSVALLLAIYVLYTAWVFSMLIFNFSLIGGYLNDLSKLAEDGRLISAGAKAHLDETGAASGFWFGLIVAAILFFSSIGYLLYSYRRTQTTGT